MPKQTINPSNMPKPKGFSHAVKVDNTIYLAGIVGVDENWKVVGDIAAQVDRAYENMRRVLEAAGARMTDVVKMTHYCRDIDELISASGVRPKYFGDYRPADTMVQVSRLAMPELRVEVEAVAVIG